MPTKQTYTEALEMWKLSDTRNQLRMRFIHLAENLTYQAEGVREKFLESLAKQTEDGLSFYDQPASTMYHGAEFGGLLVHSLQVYDMLHYLNLKLEPKDQLSEESMGRCALFHDLCKFQIYSPNILKDGSLATKAFSVDDQIPLGHGEKSVIMLQSYFDLTPKEMMLIRFHMGPYDKAYWDSQSYAAKAYKHYLLLYLADHFASLLEGGTDE